MELTTSLPLFSILLLGIGAWRIAELMLSRKRSRDLAARGAHTVAEPHFPVMVALHVGVLLGAGCEAWIARRAPSWPLFVSMAALVLAANALRVWTIATLGKHWNVRIMNSLGLGVVTGGPYRFVRHPNYIAVFVELAALPLVHAAYVTAAIGAIVHLWVLDRRIQAEDAVLFSDPVYRAVMGRKPRFIP